MHPLLTRLVLLIAIAFAASAALRAQDVADVPLPTTLARSAL